MLDYIIEKYGEDKMLCCGVSNRGLDYYAFIDSGEYAGWDLFFSFIPQFVDPEKDYTTYVTPTVKEILDSLGETTICVNKNEQSIIIYPRKEYNEYQNEKNV